MSHKTGSTPVFERLMELLKQSGAPYTVHEHAGPRTAMDIARMTSEPARLVKTEVFRKSAGGLVLAVVPSAKHVDHDLLAGLVCVEPPDLTPLSPEEIRDSHLGVEPTSVSPLPLAPDMVVCLDEALLLLGKTIFCGIGRPDRTLEISPSDLIRLTNALSGNIAR